MAEQSICLCMIVKNEAPVIRRCLDSVRAIINHWIIVDTGSTDGTQEIVRDHLRDLPGELHERPWQDFAHNRTEALELARGRADYTLIIDADDVLEIQPGLSVQALTADSYTLDIHDTSINYQRTQLVRSALPWRYEGVLHEYLTCDGAGPAGHLDGVVMRRNHDGARRHDPETYRRDARTLEAALADNISDFLRSRYTFYLAQSYRDCGDKQRALEYYLKRAELGFWQEEVFVALYEAAKIIESEGRAEQEVIDAYLRASDALPARAEALHGASRFCRYKGRHEEGYQIAKRGLEIPVRTDALFLETWIYETGLLDEYAINGYWSNHFQDCLNASLKMLATGKVPAHDMQRVVANARFASERLPIAREPNLGEFGKPDFVEQHALLPSGLSKPKIDAFPRVLIVILAKQKEKFLPLYLSCIEALDYPKSSLVLYIRTNNNTDGTEQILQDWVSRVGHSYAAVEFDSADVSQPVQNFGVHEWNSTRFSVLGRIRNISLSRVDYYDCAFYFVADVDNFIRPETLTALVSLNLPIVAPFLRSIDPGNYYSNYHAEVDGNGYYRDCDQYHWLLFRYIRGVNEVPVVHCTYLIRADVIPQLTYEDGTRRHEYVVFSHSARASSIKQFLDNREIYGYVIFDEGTEGEVKGKIASAKAKLSEARALVPSSTDLIDSQPPPSETLHRSVGDTLSLLTPMAVVGFDKVRVGRDADGGYVMVDNFPPQMTCYSLGIEREVSWDLAMAEKGGLVFQYDFSVEGPPVRHNNFRFASLRIADVDNPEDGTARLDTLFRNNSSDKAAVCILKMDIEDSEWSVLESLSAEFLDAFDQILIEFHWLERIADATWRTRFFDVFTKLRKTHVPIHVHANNCGRIVTIEGHYVPTVLEVSFVHARRYLFKQNKEAFPTSLDFSNQPGGTQYDLGNFQFAPFNRSANQLLVSEWLIEGMFKGTSGFSNVTRSLARALEAQFSDQVRILQFDGPLGNDPEVKRSELLSVSKKRYRGQRRINIYKHFYPRAPTLAADLNVAFVYCEVSRYPSESVAVLNTHYNLVLTASEFVKRAIEASGVTTPVINVGHGHDFSRFLAIPPRTPCLNNRSYTFLHVSACDPRKGVDVLLNAFSAAFSREDKVKLIIKASNWGNGPVIEAAVRELQLSCDNLPVIEFFSESLDEKALADLYASADCIVLPTRGEGLNLPAAEAIAAGKHLIVTGYSGHMDFVGVSNARLLAFELRQAVLEPPIDGALWAEPDQADLTRALQEALTSQLLDAEERDRVADWFAPKRWIDRISRAVAEGHYRAKLDQNVNDTIKSAECSQNRGSHIERGGLRIIASMTTIPSRIEHLRPTIEAVLGQTVIIDRLELNIPYFCLRTGEAYVIPAWLEEIDRVSIFRTEDYGPITKIAPTLLRHRGDNDTYIWSVDDDFAYPPDQLALLLRAHDGTKHRILTRYGGKLNEDGTVQFWYGDGEVSMFEGFGSVLYPPGCIKEDFEIYIEKTSANSHCRKNDDIVLAMYFNSIGQKMYLYNHPSDDVPYMLGGVLPHAKQDALSANGHVENYKAIYKFVTAYFSAA